ncbi:MAG: ribosome small subunit-dependent GTPase A [Bacteroidetes bacterium]|nr:ribosome small subunit-dependent GTPase A [Bacteroidota bacterium]
MKGIVIKSTGSWYTVKSESGQYIDCKIKGQFRIKGLRTTNPVAIGDHVEFDYLDQEDVGVIRKIEDRQNYIVRKSTKLSKQSHIIASNIDQAFLIVTLMEPRTSTGFMDRFLVTAEAYHIPCTIIFNKIDLYNDEAKELHKATVELYQKIGYKCLEVSAETGLNIDVVANELKGKKTLLAGHSGVGKSTIINKIQPDLDLKTGSISSYHKKGTHTTTFAEMFELDNGGFIIDTPGIKEFGLIDFDKQEVAERFPEMRAMMHDCKYHNCTHIHEPDCAVLQALEDGSISRSRYENYLNIFNDDNLNQKHFN